MKSSVLFMLKYVSNRRWFLLGYLALFLESITLVIAVLLQRDLIDSVFVKQQYQAFPLLILLYALFFFSPKLFFTVRRVIFSHVAYDIQRNLMSAFIHKVYALPTEEFNKEHAGKLLNNIRNDISDASEVAVNQLLSDGVKSLATVLVLSICLAYINPLLFFVVIFLALIYYYLLHRFGEKTKQYSQNVRTEKGNLSISIEESISSVREIVAYNRQKWQMENFEKSFASYFQAIINEGYYKAQALVVSEPFLYGTKLLVILFGGMSAVSNNISLGEFVVSFTLVDQLVTELGQIFQQALTGKRLAGSVNCILDVMNQPSKDDGTLEFKDKVTSIKFEDVTFSYSSDFEPVLRNLSIDFPVGKKIALVGESGSGKSTITQLLLRAYAPNEGRVLLNNTPISDFGNQFTDKIAVVFQQPHFLPTTIKMNITFDKAYDSLEVETVCKNMLCHDFIEDFPDKYDTEVGERGAKLSGGQKQRIALSRALLRNTEVLIMDEATSALDMETEYRIQQKIDEIRKGKTTIIIAHRLSTIQNADIIYVLSKGRIVAQGTHEILMRESSEYKDLYRFQQVS